MMWQFNKWYEEYVDFWNEELPDIENGYSTIDKEDTTSLSCYIVDLRDRHLFDNMGRHTKDTIIIQISKVELDNNSFTIYDNGRTHFIVGGNTYRVMERKDYSRYTMYQLIEILGVKIAG